MQLWIDKYKPGNFDEFVGNKKAVEMVNSWVSNFSPGKALILYGSCGSGKSLLVDILAKESRLDLLKIDLDIIDKQYIEEIVSSSKNKTLFSKGKIILIDDIETVSGRSKGVIPAIKDLIKQSRFPVIIITSDLYSPKTRQLKDLCEVIKFNKIPSPSISKRLGDLCKKEGIKADDGALKALARFSQGDLRSAITDLQIACVGSHELLLEDLSALGYRERELAIFDSLQTVFHSRSLSAGRSAIMQTGEDSDNVFWWVETNLIDELKTNKEIREGYELLSKADLIRSKVPKQQNWRFKAIASDLISGISVLKESHTGFVMYKPPQRILMLGRTKTKREATKAICKKLGDKLHCSNKIIKGAHLPYLKLIFKKDPGLANQLGLNKDEVKLISS